MGSKMPTPVVKNKEETTQTQPGTSKMSMNEKYFMTELLTNFIKIDLDEKKVVYQYEVVFNPPIDVKQTRFHLVNLFHEMYPYKIFDGKMLYTPIVLPYNEITLTGTLGDDTNVQMTMILKSRRNIMRENAKIYKVLLRDIMETLGMVKLEKYYIDPNDKTIFYRQNVEIWKKLFAEITNFEDGLYMKCDLSYHVLQSVSVLQIMIEMEKNMKFPSNKRVLDRFYGKTIITHYTRKSYRIDDIDFSMTPLSYFSYYGTKISFVKYYQKMYGIKIQNYDQPMLISTTKEKDISKKKQKNATTFYFLVPELCSLKEITLSMLNDTKLPEAIEEQKVVTPEDCYKTLIRINNSIVENEEINQKLNTWGFKFHSTPMKIESPIYKTETILFRNGIKKKVSPSIDWGMNIAQYGMYKAEDMMKWVLLFNSTDLSVANIFCSKLIKYGESMGMNVQPPVEVEVVGARVDNYIRTIQSIVTRNPGLQIIVCLLCSKYMERWNLIQQICSGDIGISTHIVNLDKVSQLHNNNSVIMEAAYKINCKLGGISWALETPVENTMIVGFDSYHGSSFLIPTTLAVVASMDKKLTEWYSAAESQKRSHLRLKTVQNAFLKLLNKFKEKNGSLPEKIIIYRNIVSDETIKQETEHEIGYLKTIMKNYRKHYNPMLTFIVVQKETTTKIFQFQDEAYGNPCPGAVIQSKITNKNQLNFYLVSQHKSREIHFPTHYTVIKNGCNLKDEQIHELTFKLCHLNYSCCGLDRIPAPVYYAQKLSQLFGENIKKSLKPKYFETLFFV